MAVCDGRSRLPEAGELLSSPPFYSARTRTEETCIRLIAGVELLTWVCQAVARADAMPLDMMMK